MSAIRSCWQKQQLNSDHLSLVCERDKSQMAIPRTTISHGHSRIEKLLCSLLLLVLLTTTWAPEVNSLPTKHISSSTSPNLASNQSSTMNVETSWKCPASCACSYTESSHTLQIDCSKDVKKTGTRGEPHHNNHLIKGVDHLILKSLILDWPSPKELLEANFTLVSLSLVDVELNFLVVCEHPLFTSSRDSLKEFSLLRTVAVQSSFRYHTPVDALTSYHSARVYSLLGDGHKRPFSLLSSLTSLTICDSSGLLASQFLQIAPPVEHIQVVNSQLYEIYSISKSSLASVVSLNVSRNRIVALPDYIFSSMSQLTLLDISHNNISHLQEQVFLGLDSLQVLIASHNQIQYIDIDVFQPLSAVRTIDLSHNRVIQFFEPYFIDNKHLTAVYMSSFWTPSSFINVNSAFYSRTEMEHLIDSLVSVETLDISDNQMKVIPETLAHLPNLKTVMLQGNLWECSCDDMWLFEWMKTTQVTFGNNVTDNLWCYSQETGARSPFMQYLSILQKSCNKTSIMSRTPTKTFAIIGQSSTIHCHPGKDPWPQISWITPEKYELSPERPQVIVSKGEFDVTTPKPLEHPIILLENGSLFISSFEKKDLGLYVCTASYENLNVTHYIHVTLDVAFFARIRLESILVGWGCSVTLLLVVLLAHFIRWALNKCGVACEILSNSQPRRVKAFFESLQQEKNSQLEKLREHYHSQSQKIKDNCNNQLERLRESYTNQSKNLTEFREYGEKQLQTLRDQYHDQTRRVANYSTHQLCKVRENYVFQRNRVCKFSGHQLFRIRETYKWQAHTLTKILENLPRTLNFDTCRGMGACGRVDSIYMDDLDYGDEECDDENENQEPRMYEEEDLCHDYDHYYEDEREPTSNHYSPEYVTLLIHEQENIKNNMKNMKENALENGNCDCELPLESDEATCTSTLITESSTEMENDSAENRQ